MYNAIVLVFKVHYASDLLNRLDMGQIIVLPRTRIDLYKTTFAFSGSSVWNSLPPKMKTYKSAQILMNK